MKQRPVFVSLLLIMAASFVVAPGAIASNTWYVNGVSGNDSNNCKSPTTACKTIGDALFLASSGDSIKVAGATYKENLTITFDVTIVGSGARTTFIEGGALNTALNTVITICCNYSPPPHVTLSGLTIRSGSSDGAGGGIFSSGAVLTVNNSIISGNSITAGISGQSVGAGICNDLGTLVINNSTISGNTARGGTICEKECNASAQGAGIYNFSTTDIQASLTLNNSTISGNDAISGRLPSSGGAIGGNGSVNINNSTISGNNAASAGGISGAATVQNTIVANNSGGNCIGTLTSKGYNLSSDGTCDFDGPGDMNNTDPLLGPLRNNGGPTQTIAELEGSLTIDAGNPDGCTDGQGHLLKTDQRRFPRPGKDKHDHRCDMGAYESQTD